MELKTTGYGKAISGLSEVRDLSDRETLSLNRLMLP